MLEEGIANAQPFPGNLKLVDSHVDALEWFCLFHQPPASSRGRNPVAWWRKTFGSTSAVESSWTLRWVEAPGVASLHSELADTGGVGNFDRKIGSQPRTHAWGPLCDGRHT